MKKTRARVWVEWWVLFWPKRQGSPDWSDGPFDTERGARDSAHDDEVVAKVVATVRKTKAVRK